jgi:glycosyltransferase involved in cell wall biosynthesis
MDAAKAEVAYVLPDKMGGVFSYVRSLLTHRRPDGFSYAAILTDNLKDCQTRSDDALEAANRVERVRFTLPEENLWAVLRRLGTALGSGPGIIVANDWIELALATAHDTGRAVIAVTHGDFDYYYQLAVRHDEVVDAYVTYSQRMAARLRELLPHRNDSIFLLRYGVDIPRERRLTSTGPLRLIYAGRLGRDKGIFDLPQIAAELQRRGCDVEWTIQGTGPDEDELRRAWPGKARWTGMQPMSSVLDGYLRQDVLVMASRNEGLPVALLEAGAAGVVPVVSNLPSGIPEVVKHGVTGFCPDPGDIRGFTDAIAELATDRLALERMSVEVRQLVETHYDAVPCTAAYQRLYADVMRRRRPWRRRRLPYGSRLDRRWIPNKVVQWIRAQNPA